MNKYIASSLVALALTVSAMGTPTVTAGKNDLILGFRASSGTGSGTNLEIDLGSVETLKAVASGSTYDFSSSLSLSDLQTAYGNTSGTDLWSRSTVFFGVAGTTGKLTAGATEAASTVWLTRTSASFNTGQSAAGLNTPSGKLEQLYTGLNGLSSTSNSAVTASLASSGGNAWSTLLTADSGFGSGTSVQTGLGVSVTKTLYLYEMQPSDVVSSGNGVTKLGSFAFNTGTGSLVYTSAFTAAAIPEPSTYAMIAGAFMLGFVALRRRFQK